MTPLISLTLFMICDRAASCDNAHKTTSTKRYLLSCLFSLERCYPLRAEQESCESFQHECSIVKKLMRSNDSVKCRNSNLNSFRSDCRRISTTMRLHSSFLRLPVSECSLYVNESDRKEAKSENCLIQQHTMLQYADIFEREMKEVSKTGLEPSHEQPSFFIGSRVMNTMPNNTKPKLSANLYQTEFLENSVGPLSRMLVTDLNMSSSGEVYYSLFVPDSASFSIDNITGQISVIQPLDRETSDIHILTVTATDRDTSLHSTTVHIVVLVGDINDNDPQFTESEYEVSVIENAPPAALLQICAIDADSGQNGQISFSILGKENCARPARPSACLFSIDGDGIFRNIVSLDFEQASRYNVTVIATDNGILPRNSTTTVTVNVVNVDEFPPTFLGPCNTIFPETEETGLIVTRCPAEDFDDTQNEFSNSTISYTITSGNQADTFTVDENGTIRNNFPLDKESLAQYTLLLTVTDEGGLSSSMQVSIAITNNQHVPVFTNQTTFTVSISKTFLSSCRFIIAHAVARDEDDGIDGEISYELLKTRQSYEQKQTLLTVAATDGGVPSFSANATITVSFSTPCLMQQYAAESRTGIIYGLFLCGIDIQPLEQNIIIDSNFLVTCTAISNLPGSTISLLHNSTLTITEKVILASKANSSLVFQRFNSKLADSGHYQCKLSTSIGTVSSNNSTLSIATYAITSRSLLIVNAALVIIPIMLVLVGVLLNCARGLLAKCERRLMGGYRKAHSS